MEEVEVAEADDPKSDAMLAKKKQMLQKQYMLDKMRMQMQKQENFPWVLKDLVVQWKALNLILTKRSILF